MTEAKLQVGDQSIDLPIIVGTENDRAIDIGKLRAQTGMTTLDPGFVNTGSCSSAITFINGEKGILRYRGYPIEQLAEKSSFIEVCYLLIYGELPDKDTLAAWKKRITNHTLIHEDMKHFFQGFPRDAHPMAILSAMVAALSTFYQDSIDTDPTNLDMSTVRLLAKLPTLAAFSYKKSIGQPLVYPSNELGYGGNFLRMMFAVPTFDFQVDEENAEVIDKLLILHADHEQNCSASTVRLVGSSRANLFAAISAGICALWGPLHGGANQRVLEMLDQILKNGGDVNKFVALAKDKTSSFRLMGFGHRVYKNFDPRAKIIKKLCDNVLAKQHRKDPLLEIAKRLEEVALADPYFVERRLYPNVDFYSGIIYKALGVPTNMFTVLFAMGRLPGWIAQYKEMLEANSRIGRPRQVYTGVTQRDYVPADER